MAVEFPSFYRGDDHVLKVVFTVPDPATGTRVPVDITGWEFFSSFKLSPAQSDDEAPVSVHIPPVSGTDATQGILYIPYLSSQTQNLLPTRYWVDIQRVYNHAVTTIVLGRVKILADVTWRTEA